MQKTELKPCPFCGGEVVVSGSSRLRTFIVSHRNPRECHFHHFKIDWKTAGSLAEATKAWNRRKDKDNENSIMDNSGMRSD